MKREEIKELLPEITKEQLDKIMSINGSDIEKAKGELETITVKATELENQVKEHKEQLKTLKDASKDNEKLQTKLTELEEANAQATTNYESKIAAMKKDSEIESKLRDANVKNVKAVKALLTEDSSLDDQIKKLREAEDTSFLFNVKQSNPPTGTTPTSGGNPTNTTAPTSLADAVRMSLNTKG